MSGFVCRCPRVYVLLWYREKRMTKRQRMKPSWWQPHYEGFYYAQMSNPTWVCCGCGSCVNPTRYVTGCCF
nr:MAG TPA: hypothetical protein [Caudoviricetes sp.]